MGRLGKGMTASLTISTKMPNNKQKARFAINDITNQVLGNLIKKFNNSPNLSYNNKKVQNEPTETYFLLIKQMYKLIEIKNHI